MMWGGRDFLRRLGLRLALAALVVQAAIPLLVAAEIGPLSAQAATDAVIAQSLCLHDGAPPQSGSRHSDCSLAFCPLCAALAAAASLGAPTPGGPSMPVMARSAPIPFEMAAPTAGAADRTSNQSRAPPLA